MTAATDKAAADAAKAAEAQAAADTAAAEAEAAKSVEQRNAEAAAQAAAEALATAGSPPEKVKLRTYTGFTEGQAAPHDLYRLATDDGLPGQLVKELKPGQRGWGVATAGENVTGQIAATAERG
jgi:hypothetical protein